MPRVRPLTRIDSREIKIREEIGMIQGCLRVTKKGLAKMAGIKESTLYAHMTDIGSMRLSEYWAIQDAARKAGFSYGDGK